MEIPKIIKDKIKEGDKKKEEKALQKTASKEPWVNLEKALKKAKPRTNTFFTITTNFTSTSFSNW